MKVFKFKSNQHVDIRINRYRIDWEKRSRSKLQTIFKQLLYPYWHNHVVLEEFRIPGSKLRVDFINLNKKIAVEVNGKQHDTYTKFFHGSRSGYCWSIKRDCDKREWLEKNGFVVLELNESDIGQFSASYVEKKFDINII